MRWVLELAVIAHFRGISRFGTPRQAVQFLEIEREFVHDLDDAPSQIGITIDWSVGLLAVTVRCPADVLRRL